MFWTCTFMSFYTIWLRNLKALAKLCERPHKTSIVYLHMWSVYIVKYASSYLSDAAKKTATYFLHANNKGADQPARLRSLVCNFVIRFMGNIMTKVITYKKFNMIAGLCSCAGWIESWERQVFSWRGQIMIDAVYHTLGEVPTPAMLLRHDKLYKYCNLEVLLLILWMPIYSDVLHDPWVCTLITMWVRPSVCPWVSENAHNSWTTWLIWITFCIHIHVNIPCPLACEATFFEDKG